MVPFRDKIDNYVSMKNNPTKAKNQQQKSFYFISRIKKKSLINKPKKIH